MAMQQDNTIIIYLRNLSDTNRFGVFLGKTACPGDIICLDGDLGAGKTALAQAIARGLEVVESCYVTSPSFAILHEYEGRIPLYHMDFYRLRDSDEVVDLGFDEYFYLSGLTLIEWSRRAMEILPDERLSLTITRNTDESRTVTLTASDSYTKRVLEISKEMAAIY